MDRKTMEERNARLEELRGQKSVADEYGIDHAAQSEQEKATKASAEKVQVKAQFDRAQSGQEPEKSAPEKQQRGSQHIADQKTAPAPSRPDKAADMASRAPGFNAQQASDSEATKKENLSEYEAFKQREEQADRDQEKDHERE